MNFPKNNAVVYLEGMGSSTYLELPEKIDYFRRHATELSKVALDPAESVKFVADIAREYERQWECGTGERCGCQSPSGRVTLSHEGSSGG
jgi:hypothetical protein